MYTDISGTNPKTWMTIGSIALIVAGLILISTPVGGILIAAGAGSFFGGKTNELFGGSFEAGWVGGLFSGIGLAVGSMVGSSLLSLVASADGLSVFGWAILSVTTSFGIGAIGGGFGNYLTQRLDKGANNIDLNSVLFNGCANGALALLGMLVPQGKSLQGLNKGWLIGFCLSGELVIDIVSFLLQSLASADYSVPRPIFCMKGK